MVSDTQHERKSEREREKERTRLCFVETALACRIHEALSWVRSVADLAAHPTSGADDFAAAWPTETLEMRPRSSWPPTERSNAMNSEARTLELIEFARDRTVAPAPCGWHEC